MISVFFFLECPIPWSLQEIRAHDAAVAGQMRQVGQDHLPSCWYAKSANGHVHDPHFSSWKVGAEACIMDFVEVHDGCPSSEKIPGLVGEIQRVCAKNSPIFCGFCVFQQHRCVTLGLLYDWSLQLSKLAWNANFSSCCLFSKFSRCRMKKKMMMLMMVIIVMTMMTTMTTMRDADEEDEEDDEWCLWCRFCWSCSSFRNCAERHNAVEFQLRVRSETQGLMSFPQGWLAHEIPLATWMPHFFLGEEYPTWTSCHVTRFPRTRIINCLIIFILLVGNLNSAWISLYFRPEIPGQVHQPIWYLASSWNAQPSSSGGFFRVRKSFTVRWNSARPKSWSSIEFRWYHWGVSAQWIPTPPSPRKKLSWSWGTWSIYFHANLVYRFFEQNSAHQLVNQNKFMKCRQWHPPKINMKHAKGTLEEIDSIWKPSFSGSMFNFRVYSFFNKKVAGFCQDFAHQTEARDENSPMALGWRSRRWGWWDVMLGWRYI